MYIGIDVGGTFTDAVVLKNKKLLAFSKHRTTKENLLDGVLAALDDVLRDIDSSEIKRVTLSTTVVTNQVVQGEEDKVDLYIIPGPGRNCEAIFPVKPTILSGCTDHRGLITEKINIKKKAIVPHYKSAAVSAKFSVRNPSEEQALVKRLQENYEIVASGAALSGSLNFPRRTNSAYFNAAVHRGFQAFRKAVEQALKERTINAPLYILKADGGSLPVQEMEQKTVESIFTGPAASVLGMEALVGMPKGDAVAIDIGGTTSDISLWQNGSPLMARGGIDVKGYPTAVRSFRVKSVGIGGDSAVSLVDSDIKVGPERKGPAMALGGMVPTLGDALIVLGFAPYGDAAAAKEAMRLVKPQGEVKETAQLVVTKAVETIHRGILEAVEAENKKPVYVVEDIVNPEVFTPTQLVVVGGTAEALAEPLEQGIGLPVAIPEAAAVANAIGAAVAKSTIEITVRIDTNKRTLVVPELGIMENHCSANSLEAAKKLALSYLEKAMKEKGLEEEFAFEVIGEEYFPVVQGWYDMSYLITVQMQLKAGVRYHVD